MPKHSVLIVEDDRSLAEVLEYNLRQEEYDTTVATSGQDGLNQARRRPPDLMVLDVMLPIVDGLEVCRRLRADPVTRSTLILMLTAKSEERDQMAGFAVGADDYVTKPFSVKVLLERIRALLRRRAGAAGAGDVLVSQGILVDRQRHRALVGETLLELTRSEFGLLETLIRHPGRVFSRSELIDSALGDDALVLERTIDVHIRALRKKMGNYADLIETVRGVGYRFRDPVGRGSDGDLAADSD